MSPARCLILTAGLAAALPAWAQPFHMRASEILGREVMTSQGERLAIRDLVIDAATGRIELLALGRPGESAVRLRLYPVSALRSADGGVLLLAVPDAPAGAGASALAPALVEQRP